MKKVALGIIIILLIGFFGGYYVDTRVAQDAKEKRAIERVQEEERAALEEARNADPNYIKETVEQAILKKYNATEFADILYQSTQNNIGFIDKYDISQNPDGGMVDLTFELHNLSNTTTKEAVHNTAQELFDIASSVSKYINKVNVKAYSFGGKLTFDESINRG